MHLKKKKKIGSRCHVPFQKEDLRLSMTCFNRVLLNPRFAQSLGDKSDFSTTRIPAKGVRFSPFGRFKAGTSSSANDVQ